MTDPEADWILTLGACADPHRDPVAHVVPGCECVCHKAVIIFDHNAPTSSEAPRCACVCHTENKPHSWAIPQGFCCDFPVVKHQYEAPR
jgi:hypothetical protein